MDYSVAIINCNNRDFLPECIDSVLKQTIPPKEFLIVDNFSSDGSREYISNVKSAMKILMNDNNIGFAAAGNQVINETTGDYILILNADIILKHNYIEELDKFIQDSIGILSGKLLNMTNKNLVDSTGQFLSKGLCPLERGYNEVDTGKFNTPQYVFSGCGAASLYNRKMLHSVKINEEYFDESFFSYCEDLDIGWRAQLFGWKAFYVPTAFAYHARGASSDLKTRKKPFLNKKLALKPLELQSHIIINRYLVLIKNCSLTIFFQQFPYVFFREVETLLYVLFFVPTIIPNLIKKLSLSGKAFKARQFIFKRRDKLRPVSTISEYIL
ncbi:MAG: glycosyltransferase family 2 protein [Candidatus Firestonebacteria bacterium]